MITGTIWLAVLLLCAGAPECGGGAGKMSARLAAGAPAFLVVFQPEVHPSAARALVWSHSLGVREHPDLLPSHLLVEGPLEKVRQLAATGEVARVLPVSNDLLEGRRVHACSGGIALGMARSQSVPLYGDGWDGPGLHAADLGYYFSTLPASLPRSRAQDSFLRAFQEWARVVQLRFLPAARADAPRTLNVLFARGEHGDGNPFDGRGRILAHSFFPSPPNPEWIAGDLHFDDDEDWSGEGSAVDLFSVVLHETGHTLGLGHSDQPGAVMYAYYRRATGLTEEDVSAIRQLYAARDKKEEPPPPGLPALSLEITSPTREPSMPSSVPTVTLAGKAGPSGAVARVNWFNSRGGDGQAIGTESWTAGPIALTEGVNLLTVTATGLDGASISRSLSVIYDGAGRDTSAPALTILFPPGTSYATYQTGIRLSGVASDDTCVTEVRWSDSLGYSGAARGTSYWSTDEIQLREGANTITVRASDAAGNIAWRAVVVTRIRRP